MERHQSLRARLRSHERAKSGRILMPTKQEIHPFFNAREFFNGLVGKSSERGHSYLVISGGDKTSDVSCVTPKAKAESIRVIEIDGVPHTVLLCRSRFVTALLKCNLASMVFCRLVQFLSEADIKRFFPSVWYGWHNEMAKKRLAAEIADHNHKIRTGELRPPTHDEAFIRGITSGMSMRSAARFSRGL